MKMTNPTTRRVRVAVSMLLMAPALAAAAVWQVPADFATIQAAIDAAADGDLIRVAPDTYAERINFLGKDVTVQATAGPAKTVIDGFGGTTVSIGPGGALAGFTITNGSAPFGAGTEVFGAGSRISANIYEGNAQQSGGFGAAIGGNSASPFIERNLFRRNTCDDQFLSGVVAFVNDSRPRIVNNVFTDNPCRAINMTLPSGVPVSVVNNTFVRNATGIRVDRRVPAGSQVYRNNIIVANTLGFEVDFGTDAENPTWQHNLVFGNQVDYEEISDQTGMNGNISANPLFVGFAAGNYRLRPASPAIDAASAVGAPQIDRARTARPQDGNGDGDAVPDIGAYEFQPAN